MAEQQQVVMNGKICMVTGATAGLGQVTALALAAFGATVIVVGRNEIKSGATVEMIKQQTGNTSVDYMLADLSSMAAVRQLAATFQEKYGRLHVLVNNAGALFMRRQETVDGLEMTFGLNHISYFLLTHVLLDVLKESAPARIVNVSSSAHYRGALDFDDLHYVRRAYNGRQAYSDSKLANVMFTYELARRLEGTGVTANALHPGLVATDFAANNFGVLGRPLRRVLDLFSISVDQGAETQIYLASSPDVGDATGLYWENREPKRSSDRSYDEDAQRHLWDASAAITGLAVAAGA